jgi:NADPH-dependent glutamate synthase beta subunit-like oxidoreductase/glutamate synthase domain-containing protein 3/NAD-dependent dihydropyrimidine dehydrogenase PreA subunit
MSNHDDYRISGKENGLRIESRVMEELIQQAVERGERRIAVDAFGQHGIGGRLWKAGSDPVRVKITGQAGQRAGAMGFPNTFIEIMGPASDDVGWLNAGATIVVHGHAGNGVANAMAQGKIYVAGNIGSRGMTMTKHNPRFAAPELWVLGSAGDYFGEFMAGGIAVICGVDPQTPDNVLGYRPLVGMVGGSVYFRGPHGGYSTADAAIRPLSDENWHWLCDNLAAFLGSINRSDLLERLAVRKEWQLLAARGPREKKKSDLKTMAAFRADIWDRELGKGGLIGDLTAIERDPIPLITTGELRRYIPVWENKRFRAPCQAACPAGIPVQERWRMIREGRMDEAVELALGYTPFPASVCGYLCPNLCMEGCTRTSALMKPVDVSLLGKASIKAALPPAAPKTGRRIAVIGGGPAGISVAWQLNRRGHEAVIYDTEKMLGGKMTAVIPESRIPGDVLSAEIDRVRQVIPQVHLQQKLTKEQIEGIKKDSDYVVLATGAWKPRSIPVPGKERLITALDFLAGARSGELKPGKRIVIIGAGNVGCDVATEAHRLGAEQITLIDVQQPASFGKEREAAEAAGARFRWPCFTKEISAEGVVLDNGELLPADTVVISIGDAPATDFLPASVALEGGFVRVDDGYRTSDEKIFAIGDMVKPGLLTDAIGAGRRAAETISALLSGSAPVKTDTRPTIDKRRVHLAYFDPRLSTFADTGQCGSQCASCGDCRDCGICVAVCPRAAISRQETADETGYAYVVDDNLCIGCGFCAGACPCGVWGLTANEPLDM